MIADELSRISMSAGLAASVSRAVDYARMQDHQDVTLEHLLMALCDDPDAVLVLAASNVDGMRLRAEVADHLGGLERRSSPPGQGVDPVLSPDLLRILEAAAAAARGGRRREINGAIVLAAIVGDGKSAAAHLLRAQGLTFEGAIRALQSARQATGPAPQTAGEILASARERVQARARGVPIKKAEAEPPPSALPPPPEPEPERAPEPDIEEVYAEIGEPMQEAQPAAAAPGAGSSDWDVTSEADRHEPIEPSEGALFSLRPVKEPEAEPAGEDEPQAMPASAPFPPPLPAPEAATGWAPPRAPDQGMLATPTPARAMPPPLPPVRVGAAEPRVPTPWPDVPPQRPPGIGSGDGLRRRVVDVGAAESRPSLLERARRFDQGDRVAPPLGAARPAGARVRAEVGQLVENIPRTMRVAVPVLVEARIARSDVQNLAHGMPGSGPVEEHKIKITKVMSVSLRAPDGGFFIESASPETQFIDGTNSLSSDDFASWRWHVTPREKGKKRLQLVISGRTVAEGIVAETALPDQVITVRVKTNYRRSFARGTGWAVAAIIGGFIAKFGEGAFDAGWQILSGFLNK